MAIVNKGEQYAIGFGGYVHADLVVESVDISKYGEVEEITGEDGDIEAMLISKLGTELKISGMVKTASTALLAAKVGDVITVNSVAYLVMANSCKRTNKIARIDITLRKPDGFTIS